MKNETTRTVFQEELLYYKSAWRGWQRFGAVILVALSGILLLPALYQLANINTASGYGDQAFGTLLAAQAGVWVIQLLVILRGVTLGIDLIRHPHSSPTYALLLVSQAPNWRIFIGKWRAGLRLMAGFIVALALIRMLILPMTTMATVTPFVSDQARYLNCAVFTPNDCPGIQLEGIDWFLESLDPGWNEVLFGLAPLTAIFLSFLEAVAALTLGMAVGVWFKRRAIALTVAAVIRFAVPLAVILLIASRQFGINNAMMQMNNPSTSYALVDAGTVATIRMLVFPRFLWDRLTQNWLDVGLAITFLDFLIIASFVAISAAFRRNRVMIAPAPNKRGGSQTAPTG